ncbi:hypothetical protein LINPERPRIM_LOCUS2543 [Linum perenne]
MVLGLLLLLFFVLFCVVDLWVIGDFLLCGGV